LPNRVAFGYFPGMKRFAALVGLALAVALPMARAQQNPDDQYIAIYSLMQQADALQAAGQPRSALAGYTQALADLQKFQKIFPYWDSKIVTFRLNYLTEKVNALAAQFPPLPESGTPPPAPTPTNAAVNPTRSAANPVSAAPAADMETQLVTLRSQAQGLQSENETLQAKLREALSAQPAAVDTRELARAQAQVLSLMKENDLLRASINTGATNSVAPGELTKVRQSLADANQKLATETDRAGKLALENQGLQARLQPLLAGSNSMETLRVENAALKKQVAGLKMAATNSVTAADARAELAKARAQIAVLQSDASVNALEKAALEDRLRKRQTPAASAPAKISDEVKTLRARLAVDEAQAVPYTPEELALLKSPAPAASSDSRKKSVNELPSGSALLVAEAQSYFSAGDYDKAEADYRQILQRDPNNAPALANLAAIELQENKLADAETHITAALAQNPDDSYTLSNFGFLKFRQQKFDEAFDALSRAAKLDPENPQIQNYLGVTLSHKGLRAQAETALRKAIQLAPNYGAAHNNLAVVYLGEKPPMAELARWHYQKALDLGQPRNPDLEKMLADMGAPVNSQ
jgi:tetratricopeptide (TPR) repeat protein